MTEAIERIPVQVRDLIGKALSEEALQNWWRTDHQMLWHKSPRELWQSAEGKERVLAFIQAALSGDMA